MQNSYDVPNTIFRKKGENVPGRPVSSTVRNLHLVRDSKSVSPKKNSSFSKQHRKTSSTSSFQDFQESTDDAWDIDDDEFCLNPNVPIHPRVAQSTAMKVLSNHSKGTFVFSNSDETNNSVNDANTTIPHPIPNKSNFCSIENKAAALQRLATQKEGFSLKERAASPKNDSIPNCTTPPPGPGIAIRHIRKKPSLFCSQNISTSSPSSSSERDAARLQNFKKLLDSPNTDIKELRELSWSGIPPKFRPVTWKLLAGYLPTSAERRPSFLERKNEEYHNFVCRYYDARNEDVHHETYRQIHIDIPRMSPLVPLFQQEIVQKAFERILYILALRHPASGYVQGMNDLVTPFFVVFLQDFIPEDADVECYDVSKLPADSLKQVETDSYWCMTKLLDGIQDNYTFAQPGIQKKVHMLKELIQRINAPLHDHLRRHSIEYLQFSFRWMNNLLMRELPLSCTIRLWDTYLSETNGFSTFHLYVCAAFLKQWSKELLQERDFQGLMLLLQNLPTLHWGDTEISVLVAEAYKLNYMFNDAPNHLQPRET